MIKRAQLRDQLQAWLDGEQSAEQIWRWALKLQQQVEPDPAAIAGRYEDELTRDVMDLLVAIPQDLITTEDAEVMVYGLNNPSEEVDLAQNLLWNHMDAIDMETRRLALADDPFYGEFCGPVL